MGGGRRPWLRTDTVGRDLASVPDVGTLCSGRRENRALCPSQTGAMEGRRRKSQHGGAINYRIKPIDAAPSRMQHVGRTWRGARVSVGVEMRCFRQSRPRVLDQTIDQWEPPGVPLTPHAPTNKKTPPKNERWSTITEHQASVNRSQLSKSKASLGAPRAPCLLLHSHTHIHSLTFPLFSLFFFLLFFLHALLEPWHGLPGTTPCPSLP